VKLITIDMTTDLSCQFSFLPFHRLVFLGRCLWLSTHVSGSGLQWRSLALEYKQQRRNNNICLSTYNAATQNKKNKPSNNQTTGTKTKGEIEKSTLDTVHINCTQLTLA